MALRMRQQMIRRTRTILVLQMQHNIGVEMTRKKLMQSLRQRSVPVWPFRSANM